MSTLKNETKKVIRNTQWSWLGPILLLAPLSLGAKGCNDAVVGDECPSSAKCGSAGSNGTAGSSNGGGTLGKVCGGLIGAGCDDGQFCNIPPEGICGAADATGICTAKPEVCTDIYSPVCGCDGMTYGNECEAAGAGVSVATEGTCSNPGSGEVCGGLQGLGCNAGEYCNFPLDAFCGAADQTGTCASMPQGCNADYNPVCGCDDMTYGNACFAAMALVSVASKGECGSNPGDACGGIQPLLCNAGEYCNFPPDAQCGAADQTGTCAAVPQACTKEYAPVCGCDDMTYGNACAAASAGVSVVAQGECGTVPTGSCGTRGGAMCAVGQYCQYAPGADCGRADAPGTCADLPQACDLIYAPVCGCDSVTYGNDCAAAMAGVSVASQGACK